jgi:hypothetical protein
VAKVADKKQISRAIEERLLTSKMQAGQRNSNGKARRAKYGIHLTRALSAEGSKHMVVFRYPPPDEQKS